MTGPEGKPLLFSSISKSEA